jgi:replication factor C large subunit
MSARNLPWVIKYRPKKVDEVINQNQAKELALKWIQEWLSGKPKRKAALFHGPPGSGKTSLVEAIANEYNLELIEMNASDYRRASDIERIAQTAALQRGLLGKGKIILLDEVDGISRIADQGALEAILNLVKVTKNPIVMTANNPWDPQLRPLRDVTLMVGFRRLTKTDVKKAIRRICMLENLNCDEDAINYLAEKAEGDLRSAINDLQAVAEGYGYVTLELVKAVLRSRDRRYEPFEVVRKIFISKYAWQARATASQSELSPDELIQWINENLPRQITHPEDLYNAYEALSKADVYMGRIVKSGSWDLLAYAIEMMTAGVALSIRKDIKSKYRWVRYSFPQRILLMSRTKEVRQLRENLASIVGKHIHVSKRVAKSDVIPYLKIIFDLNPEYAARLAVGLNLSDHMIKYLTPTNASKIISLANKLRKEIAEASKKKVEEVKETPLPAEVKEGKKKEKKPKGKRKKKPSEGGLESFLKKG